MGLFNKLKETPSDDSKLLLRELRQTMITLSDLDFLFETPKCRQNKTKVVTTTLKNLPWSLFNSNFEHALTCGRR